MTEIEHRRTDDDPPFMPFPFDFPFLPIVYTVGVDPMLALRSCSRRREAEDKKT
jgi:hypothetical protein